MRKIVITVLIFVLTAAASGCTEEKSVFRQELSIEEPSVSEIAEVPDADEIIETIAEAEDYEKPVINPTSVAEEPVLAFDPIELVELNAEYGKEQDDAANVKKAESGAGASKGSSSSSGSGKGGLTDSQRAWLSVSTLITEEEVLAYKSLPDSNSRLDAYGKIFEKAMCEMNNCEYDYAKALYDSDPARYTPKDYYDKLGYYKHTYANGSDEVITDSFITISAECFYEAENYMISKYGAKYPADYLRLIGVG